MNTFLAGALLADEAVLIARHLAECPTCPALVELQHSVGAWRPNIPVACAALGPGDAVGRYVLLHRVGAGGMGVVWAAYDPELDRRLAIKLLGDAAQAVPDLRERFEREARITARLQHPSIVHVQEAGQYAPGEPYYVMKLVTGDSLEHVIAQRPRLADRLALVPNVSAIIEAIAYAHSQGVIHRDLKPQNVIVGAFGETVVIDWGLATSSSEATDGMVMGTPSYMPPEQAEGDAVDERADVYALGAILYHVLAGVRPYAGRDAPATFAAVIGEPPAPLATLAPTAPAELVTIVNKAMARSAGDRYPSAKQLADELAKFMTGQLVGSHRYSRRELAWRWVRRHRTAITAGSVLVLGGLAVFGLMRETTVRDTRCEGMEQQLVGVWDAERAAAVRAAFVAGGQPYAVDSFGRITKRLEEYSRGWVATRVAACEATHLRGVQSSALLDLRMRCLDRRLSELDQHVRALASTPRGETLEHAIRATTELVSLERCNDSEALLAVVPPPRDPAAQFAVTVLERRLDKASALQRLGRYRDSIAELEGLAREAARLAYPPIEAQVHYHEAQTRRLAGQFAQAEAAARLAVDAAARAKDDELLADAWIELVGAISYLDQRETVTTLEPFARAAVSRAGDVPFQRSRFLNVFANSSFKQLDLKRARELYEQSLALGDRKDPRHRATLVNLAMLTFREGKYADAKQSFEELLVLEERDLGSEHPDTARVLYHLCLSTHSLGELAAAQQHCERAVAVRERSLGPDDPRTADALELLGTVLGRRADSRAEDYLRRAVQIKENKLGPEHAEVGRMIGNLAQLLQQQGELVEAIALSRRALEIALKARGPDHPLIAYPRLALGTALADAGDHVHGRVHLEASLALFTKALGADHPNIAHALIGLARCDLALGNLGLALDEAQRSFAIRERAEQDPAALAEASFVLAQTLWETKRDRPRALSLARSAADRYAGAGAGAAKERAAIADWLRTRTGS
ncbi:MAG: serine/threonine protein kinase [Deltaproteobacteria bacterium]|nr:serine/threonine protein kinase [Deltaproteobacteria bacterium]